jgi:hypothetical protein
LRERIEAAAAAEGKNTTRWVIELLSAAVPPQLDDADTAPPRPAAGRRRRRPPRPGQGVLDDGQEDQLAS